MLLSIRPLLLVVLCLSATGILAKPNGLFGDFLNGVGDATKDLAGSLRGAASGVPGAFEDYLHKLISANKVLANSITQELVNTVNEIRATLENAIANLQQQFVSEKDKVKKAAANDGLKALNELKEIATDLQISVTDINRKLANTVNGDVTNAVKQLRAWEQEQLKRVDRATNGAGLSDAQDVTSDLIKRIVWNLKSCETEVDYLRIDLESQLNDRISSYRGIVRKLIHEMNQCAKWITTGRRCQNNVEALIKQLSNAPNDLAKIVQGGDKLVTAGENGSKCVGQVLTDLEKAIKQAEDKLNQIIKNNQNDPETSPTAEQEAAPEEVSQPEDSVPSEVSQPEAEQEAAPEEVSQPEEAAPEEVAQPEDSVPSEVSQPEDSVPSEVSQPEEAAPEEVAQPEDSAPAEVSQPEAEQEAAPEEVSQPEDAAPEEVAQPEDSAPAEVSQPEEAAPEEVAQPEDSAPAEVSQPEEAAPEEVAQPEAEQEAAPEEASQPEDAAPEEVAQPKEEAEDNNA